MGGLVPWKQRLQYTRHIGAVFGQRTQLWWDLAVVESFRLLKKIYEVDDATYDRADGDLRRTAGHRTSSCTSPCASCRLGQRMRCDLAAALLHRPRVLFLDEPTIGLDVVAKENVRVFLREIREREGVTVILTTHDLGDIEQLCRRVIIIDKGQVHFDGELDDLRRRVGRRVRMTVELRDSATSAELAADHRGAARGLGSGARACATTPSSTGVEVPGAEVIKRLVNDCHVSGPAPGRAGHRGDRARDLPAERSGGRREPSRVNRRPAILEPWRRTAGRHRWASTSTSSAWPS